MSDKILFANDQPTYAPKGFYHSYHLNAAIEFGMKKLPLTTALAVVGWNGDPVRGIDSATVELLIDWSSSKLPEEYDGKNFAEAFDINLVPEYRIVDDYVWKVSNQLRFWKHGEFWHKRMVPKIVTKRCTFLFPRVSKKEREDIIGKLATITSENRYHGESDFAKIFAKNAWNPNFERCLVPGDGVGVVEGVRFTDNNKIYDEHGQEKDFVQILG